MTSTPFDADALVWEPPGPGFWEWQGSHVPSVPTPIYTELHIATITVAIGSMFERYGVPLRTMDEVQVNGRLYTSLQPLVGKAGAKAPPAPLLWLVTRLHPEFRRRNKAAAHALEHRIWRARTEEWKTTLRPELRRTNLVLQGQDLTALDDAALADHVHRAHDHVVDGHLLHFDLHGDDIGPLGLYLAACRDWGIEPGDAIAALTGHSPSTMAAVDALRKVAVAYAAASGPSTVAPSDLAGLRAVGPGVGSALDEYLAEYGWRVVTGYDLDAKTVGELPEVLVASVLSMATEPADPGGQGDAAAAALRTHVPAAEQPRFDEVLIEARTALDLRDDNGPITVEWPIGLLRHALLEVGRRAVARGALAEAQHGVELTLAEVDRLLAGDPGPGAEAVTRRATDRAAAGRIVPPSTLGQEVPPPGLRAFPSALAAVTDMALTAVALMERASAPTPASGATGELPTGLGVGREPYRGQARVAHTAEDALASLEPGDVLVVPFTTPAYNAVLAIAGGLVTEEGGALWHAAVLARELELPAVIGVPGALGSIADGDEVEVDPTAGTVRVLVSRERVSG